MRTTTQASEDAAAQDSTTNASSSDNASTPNTEQEGAAEDAATPTAVGETEAAVETAQDLSDAITKINSLADGSSYTIRIAGEASSDPNTEGNVLSLGDASYHITGNKTVTIKDNGSKVGITRTVDGTSKNDPLFIVEKGAYVTVDSGKTGSDFNLSYSKQKAPFARVTEGASLTVNGGAFEENEVQRAADNHGGYGAVLQNGYLNTGNDFAFGGLLTVSGGLFKGNTAHRFGGGAIFSYTRGTDASTTVIAGGDFEGNTANVPRDSGGVLLRGGGAIHSRKGSLTVSGGTFKNNAELPKGIFSQGRYYADVDFTAGGGAIYVCNANADNNTDWNSRASFTLAAPTGTGEPATFEGNSSGSAGGAIMLAAQVNGSFEAGTFANNTCEDMGGAVYTEENTGSEFGKTVAYGNKAGHFGGGLWLCPSGVNISSQSSNLALFDNEAGGSALSLDPYVNDVVENGSVKMKGHGAGAAGDDLAIMYPNKDFWGVPAKNSTYISNSWYSGKNVVTWYEDGQSTVKATGFGEMGTNWGIGHLTNPDTFSVVASVPRYQRGVTAPWAQGYYELARSNDDIPVWNTKGGIALKAIPLDNQVKETAKSEAKLTFTGNTAGLSGGAIASDGNLSFTSSGVASWTKVDANDGTAKGGSSWTLTYSGQASWPYASDTDETELWNGSSNSAAWKKVNGTWTATVEDNTGQSGYVGYDTDTRAGYFSIGNLSQGTFTMKEAAAPDGYTPSAAEYTFTVDLSTAETAATMPQIKVVGGGNVANNAIGNTPMPSIPSIELKAKKTLSGGKLTAGKFSFDLDQQSEKNGAYTYTSVQAGVTNQADGSVTFTTDKLTYTAPGDYIYRISERHPDDAVKNDDGTYTKDGITYDSKACYVKVFVKWGWKDSSGKPVPEGAAGATAHLVASVGYFSDEACKKPIANASYPDYAPEFTNYVSTDWSFTKVDKDSDDALAGATFKLFRLAKDATSDTGAALDPDNPGADWTLVGESASADGTNGTVLGRVSFTGLRTGTYRLVETKAVDGYMRPSGQWAIAVDTSKPDGQKVSVTGTVGATPPAFKNNADGSLSLPNYKGFTLPVSGAQGAGLSALVGAALIAASLGALYVLRRRGGVA